MLAILRYPRNDSAELSAKPSRIEDNMLTINTISGILNFLTNGRLGTQLGTSRGSQNRSDTLESANDLSATHIVTAPVAVTNSSRIGSATTDGGMADGTAGFLAKTQAPTPSGGTVQADENVVSSPAGPATHPIPQTNPMESLAADQSHADQINIRLLTAMAVRSFRETAKINSDTGATVSELGYDNLATPNVTSASALAIQERTRQAELHVDLSKMPETREVDPADASRMMAGHTSQFPLEDPDR
jgi:hypothetical protein